MSSTEQQNDRRALDDRTERAGGDSSLMTIERELKKQSRSIRRTQQGFALFAAAALLIALVNLVTTSLKLGTKDVRVARSGVAAAPAAAGSAAAPAQKGAATPTTPPHSLNVSLKEFKVLPSVDKAAAGKVTFHVRNIGTVKHEFVVIKTNKPAADLLKGNAASEKGRVGEIDGLDPGKSGNLALHLKPGHYALICNQPGHYKLGQHIDFNVS